MKKSVLVAALLLVSAFSFNSFAEEKEAEEVVTVRELITDGATASFQAALMLGYFAYLHDYVKPAEKKSATGLTFDLGLKGFCAAVFGDKAKSFFEKFMAFMAQQSKPLTDPALETIKTLV